MVPRSATCAWACLGLPYSKQQFARPTEHVLYPSCVLLPVLQVRNCAWAWLLARGTNWEAQSARLPTVLLPIATVTFPQVRNLCLGLAARGINWEAQGGGGSLNMAGRLCVRLFGNLFQRSEKIAQAMVVRGFQGPEQHNTYCMRVNPTSVLANVAAVALLAAFSVVIHYYK